MKKVVLVLLLLILTACTPSEENKIVINDNDFLSYEENASLDINTYYLDLYLDDENHTLEVTGRLLYIVSEETNLLNLRIYPKIQQNSSNFNLEYLKVNQEDKPTSFDSVNTSLIEVEFDSELIIGEVLEIDFSYTFNYWIGEGRISYYDDYYITMFFYPFIQINNDEPVSDYNYAFNGESYYNTIGDYYVSINAPEEYIIASSGKEMNNDKQSNRTKTDYFLNDGRDFSFSASNHYQVYERSINDIDFTIYAIRELTTIEIEDNFKTLENAFEVYEDYVGDYPYDYFNLEFGNIYGMESTGVIYCSDDISIYTVVHEVIHQWFYSIIHNDQAREPFLDEALTTYTTFIYFYEVYGIENANGYLDYRSSLKEGFEDYFSLYQGSSLYEDVHEYQTGYGYIIYYHGPTLYRYYFDEILDSDFEMLKEFLQVYYDEFAFKEVSTIEMLELLEEITGVEGTKDWFLDEIIYLDVPEPLH